MKNKLLKKTGLHTDSIYGMSSYKIKICIDACIFWNFRIFREKQYAERRLKDFEDALNREAVGWILIVIVPYNVIFFLIIFFYSTIIFWFILFLYYFLFCVTLYLYCVTFSFRLHWIYINCVYCIDTAFTLLWLNWSFSTLPVSLSLIRRNINLPEFKILATTISFICLQK